MKKALVLTVGTGTRQGSNIVDPLCKVVKGCNPNFTVFITTEISKSNAKEIASKCHLRKNEYRIVKLIDENDLEKVSFQIEGVINSLVAKRYKPEEIDLDFTSGTKPMSAAAVLSAIRSGCSALRYVSGERDQGVVVSGRERLISFPISGLLAVRELDLADDLLKRLQFRAVAEIIHRIEKQLTDKKHIQLAAETMAIAKAYEKWEMFDHQGFLKTLKEIKFKLPSIKCYKIKEEARKLLEEIVRERHKGRYSLFMVIDLLNNAERRAIEGKFDDAVAQDLPSS